ncbi:MAG TPA: protein kinase [Gemmatimonadales bacterium]|nr:protein kinase [Gemmatimonadales bacterium]
MADRFSNATPPDRPAAPGAGPVSSGRDPAAARFEPGDSLAGRYRIARRLGSGGMGEVYEAEDQELGIAVALKVLKLEPNPGHDELRALKREVLLARLVTHANVCRVYDLGRAGDTWYLTMELLAGETLGARLQRAGRLPPAEALGYARQIAAGLAAAHGAGVVHRDFKPDNVMLLDGPGGRLVITDFGIARAAAFDADADVIAGTPDYMAPEQMRGETAGPQADLYAFGTVLFEMVTGRLPFEGGSSLEVAARRLYEPPPSARAAGADIDERWEHAIARCLAPEPADRFATAGDVIEALAGPAAAGGPASVAQAAAPPERDAFFGREAELIRLERLFTEEHRLVSVLGPGGMGKTRLAAHFAHRTQARWPGGVWFCDLTEAPDSEAAVAIVAGTLGVPPGRAGGAATLGHAIAGRGTCLIVLDNVEQIAGGMAELLGEWTGLAPEARFLVTSRERLQMGSEHALTLAELPGGEAAALFVDRARRQRPGLAFSAADLAGVARLVELLDGMPLAIELAAARMRTMTVDQLLERMHERFRLLAGGPRRRHATLRVTLDASWELLRPWERSAWAQCAIFHGGFTLEAAEQVLDLSAWPEAPWVVDVMQALADRSIVRVMTGTDPGAAPQVRFGMYVSLQEYARGRLAGGAGADSGAARALELRHGRHFARLGAGPAIEAMERHDGSHAWRSVAPELENLIVACRRALARGDAAVAAATFRAAAVVLEMIGPYSAAATLGREVLAAPLTGADRLRALLTVGRMEWRSGQLDASHAHFTAAAALARERDDPRAEAAATLGQSQSLRETGRLEEALALQETALALARRSGDRDLQAVALTNVGVALGERGQTDASRACFDEALAIARAIGNRRSELLLLVNLGVQSGHLGHVEEQLACYARAIPMAREIGDRRMLCFALGYHGAVAVSRGRLAEARPEIEEALAIARAIGDRRVEGLMLGRMGTLHLASEALEEAYRCLSPAVAIASGMRDSRSEADARQVLAATCVRLGRLEEAERELERSRSLLGPRVDPQVRGTVMCVQAMLESRRGRPDAAAAELAAAEALAGEIGAGTESDLRVEIDKVRRFIAGAPA